jgi:glycosyltransferase involved in cell wall biosynthesis
MRVNVVTPWYPSDAHPYSGVFVRQQVEALNRLGADVDVEVPEIFPAPEGAVPRQVMESLSALAESDPRAAFQQEGSVTRVPAPVPSGIGVLGRARVFEELLRLRRRVDAPEFDLTHAHLGVPTGLAVMELSQAPLVVTEHQSALPRLLEDEGIRRAYRTLIDRSAAFLTVSTSLRETMIGAIGATAADIEVVPNIVDFESLLPRADLPIDFRKWLYVGTLAEHKGVGLLLDAFTSFVKRHDPDATLDLVGEGPMRPYVESTSARRGIDRMVTIHGALPHHEIPRHLATADVLVHLSPFETFGIAAVEAIASGTPVVVRENGGSTAAWGDIASKCGLLLDRDVTADDVADAIVELRGHTGELDLGAARQTLAGRFSAEVVGRQLLAIYSRHVR